MQSARLPRTAWPQQVLVWLPLTLFFPIGVVYAGVLVYLLALLLSGQYAARWQSVRRSPMFFPVLGLSVCSGAIAVLRPHAAHEFGSGLLHYQSYWFLLLFLAAGGSDLSANLSAHENPTQKKSGFGTLEWQSRAQIVFFGGALLAATLFYANALHLLPNVTGFKSYAVYDGNKSILLGVLLALAAGWMMHAWRWQRNHHGWRALALLYVVFALFVLAKTRTASLLFLLLCGLMLFRHFKWRWPSLLSLAAVLLLSVGGVRYVLTLPAPVTCLANQMSEVYHMPASQVIVTRGICTVQQLRDFWQGKKISEDGMRLEIYRNTSELVAEQPLFGHGIGNWLPLYQQKAVGQISAGMTTPHNDYLLYATELGAFGVAALLWIWITQLRVAYQMSKSQQNSERQRAMLLAMLGVAMMLGGMFNAILRDGVFAMAFMILLAIPLAGVERQRVTNTIDHNKKQENQ